MNVLLTGGAGFIGSNLVRLLLAERAGWRVVVLDKLTYAGNAENLADLEGNPRYRFVRGNPKALRLVYVPTPQEEARRCESRFRQSLRQDRLALATRGRMLLLSQGYRESNGWWKERRWHVLASRLPAWLKELLEVQQRLLLSIEKELAPLTKKVEQAAPAQRPLGMGRLTLEEINREICSYQRFKNRKAPGSYAGLVGGVSASGTYHCDLSITKAGNLRLRTLVIELAWRMVKYQAQCPLIQRWKHILLNPRAHKRARKRAIVAVARQLLADLWRWQTGRITPAQLGWLMVGPKNLDLDRDLEQEQNQ